jgi:hypothetical protein
VIYYVSLIDGYYTNLRKIIEKSEVRIAAWNNEEIMANASPRTGRRPEPRIIKKAMPGSV